MNEGSFKPEFAGMRPDEVGQNIEWLVWIELSIGSLGGLHIFLPTKDMGIDGIARRPLTDEAVAIQVKGRTNLDGDGILRVHIQENEAGHDDTKVVVVMADLTARRLRSPALVISVGELKELSTLTPYGPRSAYPIELPYPPGTRTRWRPFCIPTAELADRVCPAGAMPASEAPGPALPTGEEASGATGLVGEMTLLACAAELETLNAFRAFPDNEFQEYLLMHTVTGGILGVQVKCVEVTDTEPSGTVHIRRHGFHPSPRACVVVFARIRGRAMHDQCLLIPAADVEAVSHTSNGFFRFPFNIAEPTPRLASYRIPVARLGSRLEALAAAAL